MFAYSAKGVVMSLDSITSLESQMAFLQYCHRVRQISVHGDSERAPELSCSQFHPAPGDTFRSHDSVDLFVDIHFLYFSISVFFEHF